MRVNKYVPKEIMLKSLNLLSVNQMVIFNTLIAIYKIVNKIWPESLSNKITYKNSNLRKQTLRNCNLIEKNNSVR